MAQRIVKRPMPRPGSNALWLGLVSGLITQWSKTTLPDVSCADLKRHDYPMSTQRLGVRFTERVRNAFRLRWIREIF